MFGIGFWELIIIAVLVAGVAIPILVVVIALAVGGIKRRGP